MLAWVPSSLHHAMPYAIRFAVFQRYDTRSWATNYVRPQTTRSSHLLIVISRMSQLD